MSRALYLAAWSASTAVAVGLSWLGIRFVLDAGVPERPRVVAGPVQHSSLVATTTTTTTTTAVTTTTAAVPPPASRPTTTTTGITTTTTTATQPLPSEEGTWTEIDGKPAYLRSFTTQGGVASVRFSPGAMQPISATPRQGYAASVELPADAVVVVFTGSGRTSRLEASWHDGPVWRVLES
ncbi:hypothetical protein JOF41_003794 [Saccharothrix coeruleofusca]|uniref:hypothetical protein n=1 Tax=Saccharothrix coeruleofusca TaxID=33919 RepID=UPI001AE2B568|nr:hypothetical protein [Saccharothrix coeruleofusca]MBP2337616.1 hypothetical protein [Saccharothrix coeruleofusca]